MLNQGYSNELSKTEMLEKNTTSEYENYDSKKNYSEEVNYKMMKVSNSKNIGMSQFHAFSKIFEDDIDDEENDSSKCSTAVSNIVPSSAKSDKIIIDGIKSPDVRFKAQIAEFNKLAMDFSPFTDSESDLESDEEENIDFNKILNYRKNNTKICLTFEKDFDEKLKFYRMFDVKAPGIKNPNFIQQ